MPFGLGLAPWDVLLTDSQLQMFFQQLAIVNLCEDGMIALVVHYADAGRVKTAMEKSGWNDVHPFYVYKPNQNQRGTNCFIFAVEIILIGYGSRRSSRPTLHFADENPVFRHNHLYSHCVRVKALMPGTQDVINPTQKHTNVAGYLASVFCSPVSILSSSEPVLVLMSLVFAVRV